MEKASTPSKGPGFTSDPSGWLVGWIQRNFGFFVLFLLAIIFASGYMYVYRDPSITTEDRADRQRLMGTIVSVLSILFALLGVFKAPEVSFNRMLPQIDERMRMGEKIGKEIVDHGFRKAHKSWIFGWGLGEGGKKSWTWPLSLLFNDRKDVGKLEGTVTGS